MHVLRRSHEITATRFKLNTFSLYNFTSVKLTHIVIMLISEHHQIDDIYIHVEYTLTGVLDLPESQTLLMAQSEADCCPGIWSNILKYTLIK